MVQEIFLLKSILVFFSIILKKTYVRKNPEITLIYEILNLNLKKGRRKERTGSPTRLSI